MQRKGGAVGEGGHLVDRDAQALAVVRRLVPILQEHGLQRTGRRGESAMSTSMRSLMIWRSSWWNGFVLARSHHEVHGDCP